MEDFVAFGGACTSWRSAASKENFNASSSSSSTQLPWLMLAEKEEEDDNSNMLRGFFSLSKGGKIHKVTLPEARGKRCMESLGWLVTAAKAGELELLHPFSRVQIVLPHQNTFKYYQLYGMEHLHFIHKAVLSASPSHTPEDYILMVIHGGGYHLGFWRPGDKTWTVIETHNPSYHDVIYFKDQFYAIDNQGVVTVCDLGGGGGGGGGYDPTAAARVRVVGRIPGPLVWAKQPYIVESAQGTLMIVVRHIGLLSEDVNATYYENIELEDEVYETASFRVFELELSNQRWQEVKNLGGRALFLGHSASISVNASLPTLLEEQSKG